MFETADVRDVVGLQTLGAIHTRTTLRGTNCYEHMACIN